MRQPVNPPPGRGDRITSAAVALTVDVFRMAPGTPDPQGTDPVGQLEVVDATLTDDASRAVQRTMTARLGAPAPTWLEPGMWLRATIGVQQVQPVIYQLPTLCVTDVKAEPSASSYGSVSAADPAEVLNGRPYTTDTTLAGTLRSVVADACSTALARPTDTSGVPAIPVPAETIAEFGTGRWDRCVRLADALGVVLRFTDPGDVVGRLRSDPLPTPVSVVELVEGAGRSYRARVPSSATVLVSRGDQPGLVGTATAAQAGVTLPAWYPPYVVTDHVQGSTTMTQPQADTLALNLIRARLADIDTFSSVPVLPAPWLEAGADVVSYRGTAYGVRAVTLDLPSLATTLTLRRVP